MNTKDQKAAMMKARAAAPQTRTEEDLRAGLVAIVAQIRSWLDWDRKHRADNKPPLTTDDGTHIMALPVPFWPSHGAFENWIKLFQECHAALAATPAVGGEPVAWRTKNEFGHWHVTQNSALADTWLKTEKFEVQPLYAAQPASPLRGTLELIKRLVDNKIMTDEEILGDIRVEVYEALSTSPPEQPAAWDAGEHEGCGIDSQRAFERWKAAAQETLRLLRKISDLAYDADVGEPLDCAIDYANKAIAVLTGSIE